MTVSFFLRFSSVISGSRDFLLRFQLPLFLVIFVFSPLRERHWIFLKVLLSDLFALFLHDLIFLPHFPCHGDTAIRTGDCSIFYLPLRLRYPLNTFTNVCSKSQTGYPTRTSKLTCPKPIILTFVS